MKHVARFLPSLFVPAFLLLLSGCGSTGDTSKSNTSPVTPAVAVAITEDSVTLAGGETHQFTANVAGLTTDLAVTWSLTGCTSSACGTIGPDGLYTATSPVSSQAKVQVVATSHIDPTKSDTAVVYLKPISVLVAPGDVWMLPGASKQFTSNVMYDIHKKGVTWNLTCSDGDCGTLHDATASSVIYTAPAAFPNPPIVTLTATSATDCNKTSQVSIAESAADTLAAGNYAFLFSGWELEFTGGYWPFRFTAAGHFRADGKGNIVEGVEDINSIHGVSQSVSFTGSYGVCVDRRGVLNIVNAMETATYRMVLEPSGIKARFIRFEGLQGSSPVSGGGYLELQDKSAFSLSALNGGYAVGLSGAGSGHNWSRVTAAGRFTVGSDGELYQGRMDLSKQSHSTTAPAQFSNLLLTGSMGAPSTDTGRGTVSITVQGQDHAPESLNFVYYVVSAVQLMLVQTDPRIDESNASVLSGEARRQHGVFSTEALKGSTIFSMAGLSRDGYGAYFEDIQVGQLFADGSGSFTGISDHIGDSAPVSQAFYGSYTMDSGGRSELRLGSENTDWAVAYFYSPNRAFVMEPAAISNLRFGDIRPQAAGPFDASSIKGTFLTVTASPTSEESENECGLTTFDGEGGATASIDGNLVMDSEPGIWRDHFELTGTYDVAPNGRGTLTFPSQKRTVIFWLVSPTEMVGNAASSSDGYYYLDWAALLEFTR